VIEGSPTYNVRAVNEVITRERPHVVVFDSSGRVAQYRCARTQGAAVVYVSSRPRTRWKGFRLRRMRYMDQHWIAQPRFLGGDLTRWERLKLRLLPHVATVFLEAIFESSDPARQAALLARLAVQPERYVVLCLGSGGRYARVKDVAQTLLSAAARIHDAAGLDCVVVTGANAAPAGSLPHGVRVVAAVPNGELMDLLCGAQLAVVNGGSLLLQAIANRVPVIAVPVAGDQADRVERCAHAGLIVRADLDAAAMARVALDLHANGELRTRLRQAMQSLALGNGVDIAVDALENLLVKA
jgi:glycosyltransferase involved in cell wall biosynthesis